jgi:hypothetical protein
MLEPVLKIARLPRDGQGMRTALLILLLPCVATASDMLWQSTFCKTVGAVAPAVFVKTDGFGNDSNTLQSLISARLKTQAVIRLRAATISVVQQEESRSYLSIDVFVMRVYDTPYARYDISVGRIERVRNPANGETGIAVVGSSTRSGVAEDTQVGSMLAEDLDIVLNQFINCVLAERDLAGQATPPPQMPAKPAKGSKVRQ